MLTGKCKERFEAYFLYDSDCKGYVDSVPPHLTAVNAFYDLPLSMQFGVIVDFADSLGYNIILDRNWSVNPRKYGYVITSPNSEWEAKCDQRSINEARKACIEAFNQLINQSLRPLREGINHKN